MPLMIGYIGIFDMNNNSENESESLPVIRGKLGHVVVYDVKEEELAGIRGWRHSN